MRKTVEIIADTSIKGVPAVIGDIVEVDAADANLLTENGKGIMITVPPEAPDTSQDSKKTKKKETNNP